MNEVRQTQGEWSVTLFENKKGELTCKGPGQPKKFTKTIIGTYDDGTFVLLKKEDKSVIAEFSLEDWMSLADGAVQRTNSGTVTEKMALEYVPEFKFPMTRV